VSPDSGPSPYRGDPLNSEALRAEIARLRAGEAETPAEEGVNPTPAQWIRKWNDSTAEQRLKWAALILDHAEQVARCFQLDHEGRLADVDTLMSALRRPGLYLSGDEDGGIGLHCHDHHDGGRPLAYYSHVGYHSLYADDPHVACVTTIPSLWAEVVKHLTASHSAEVAS